MEGRRVFGNIIKYIRMGASSNFGNMFSVVGGSFFLPFLPMMPIQVLVNNLLYDFSQLGIPTDKVDEEYLATPRKWNIDNVRRFMMYIGPISSIFDYATFALMWYVFGGNHGAVTPELAAHYGADAANHTAAAMRFHTGWFVESLLTQTLIVHIIRTRRIPFIESAPSATLFFGTLIVMAIGVWLPYSALAPSLGLVPLPAVFWAWIAGFLVSYAALCHFVKVWFHRKFGVD